MSELQAAIEIQVELGKFYNVDLFQRGYYQIRTSLKMSQKVTAKVDISVQKETGSRLVMPGSVANGIAISKTFQILYRKEDIDINDIIAFKVYMLVDMLKIDESIADADFQLSVELWFTEEDFSPSQQEKLQCLSQRNLKLHFFATKGIHHYVPLLFDYFHLSAICLTVHGTLIALHQPYISLSRSQQRASGKVDQTLESALFSASANASTSSRNSIASSTNRKRLACQRHRRLCQILLSAYESIQTSFENLTTQLHNKIQMKIDHVDCRSKLEEYCTKCQAYASTAEEEDLFQAIQSDLATLCSQNVILWMQYLELITLNDAVTYQLAKEHHTLRVKRFSEGFFINEYQKQEMIDCYDPNIHGHIEIANQIRNSHYYQSIPSLSVECVEVDGDAATIPIIFEDTYSEPMLDNAIRFRSESGSKASNRKSNRESCYSNDSAVSSESSTSITRKTSRLKFIRNVKPESLRRPSSYMNADDQVAVDNVDCTLVGYRKLDHLSAVPSPPVELGTLTTSNPLPSLMGCGPGLFSAMSLPTLASQSHEAVNCSGSLPDLALNTSVRQLLTWSKHDNVNMLRNDSSSNSTLDISVARYENEQLDMTITKEPCNGDETLTMETDGVLSSKGCVAFPEDYSLMGDSNKNLSLEMCKQKEMYVAATVSESEEKQNFMDAASDVLDCKRDKVSENVENNSIGAAMGEKTNRKVEGAIVDSSADFLLVTDLISGKTLANDKEALDLSKENTRKKHQSNDVIISGRKSGEDSFKSLTETVVSSSQVSLECNEDGVSTSCTVLELIKEEYARNQTDGGTSSSTSSLLSLNSAARTEPSPKHELNKNEATTADVKLRSKPSSMSATSGSSEKPQRLVDEVTDKIVRFISAKEQLRSQLDLRAHFYSDFPSQISSLPYFTPSEKFFPLPDEGIHLIVCVHGLDGNSTDLRLVRTYLELALPSNKIEFLMSERNQVDTFADFEVMTDRLVQEILYHIELFGIKPSRISFIGHSLGNLIIRSAMSRPQMTELLPKLHTFLSLSGPHLGTLFNSSGLVNMGMWLMQKWKKSGSLLQLSLKDHQDPRQTFLYKLSQKTGLEFFRNILLVGSQQDRYVPFHSSRIELCKAALRDTSGWGAVYTEMVNNILQPIIYKSDINFIRYDVFHALSGTTNHLIGRAAHIAVLDSELFIEKFISVAALKYFI